VGIGAIIFGDLSNDRIKDVEFDWDKILDFPGRRAPTSSTPMPGSAASCGKKPPAPEESHPGRAVYGQGGRNPAPSSLGRFPEAVERAAELNKPSVIARYLVDLARDFNQFYHHCPVLKAEGETKNRPADPGGCRPPGAGPGVCTSWA
jgi:arginyl-tRNA synthetase